MNVPLAMVQVELMANLHEEQCKWCDAQLGDWRPAEPLYGFPSGSGFKSYFFTHIICPKKPPLTPEEGAYALATFITLGEAIRAFVGK